MQPVGLLMLWRHQLTRAWWLVALLGCGRTELVRYDALPPVLVADAGSRDAGVDAGVFDAGTCAPGFVMVDGRCVEIAASLEGLRWELPCVADYPEAPDLVCVTTADVRQSTVMRGPPGALYDVVVRIRGVVEPRAYVGGTRLGDGGVPFVVRGAEAMPSAADAWNVYRLEVNDPAEHWSLNGGQSGQYFCGTIDAVFPIRVRTGATVSLFASSVDQRRSQIRNIDQSRMPLIPPGVPPAPRAFDGQFLQLNVLSVTRVP